MKKYLFFFAVSVILTSCGTFLPVEKKAAPGITASIHLYPDEIKVHGKDGKEYYFFYSLAEEALFVTDKKQTLDDARYWLPVKTDETHYVMFEGTSIDPFTLFEKEELEKNEQLALKINSYRTYKITGYGQKIMYITQ